MLSSPPHHRPRLEGVLVEIFLWVGLLWGGFLVLAQEYPMLQDLFVWDNFWSVVGKGMGAWDLWFFAPSRYFFPDALVAGVTHFVSCGNMFAAVYLQFCVYAVGFVFLLAAVLQRGYAVPAGMARRLALFLAVVFSLVVIVPRGVTLGLLWPQFRGGTQLMVLGGILLAMAWGQKGNRAALWGLFALSFFGVMGDKLFLLWFVAPLGVWLFFQKNIAWVDRALSLLFVGTFAMLGNLLGEILSFNNHLLYAPSGVLLAYGLPAGAGWALIWQHWLELGGRCPFGVFLLTSWLWLPWVKMWKKDFCSWDIFLILGALLPLLAAGFFRTYTGVEGLRYFPFVFFVPALWLGVMLWPWVAKLPRWASVGAAAFFCVLCGVALSKQTPAWGWWSYPYPVRAVDFAKKQLGLKDGLSSYWYCKTNNQETRQGAYLFPIDKFGGLAPIMTNMAQLGVGKLPGPRHDYNYIFANTLYVDALLERFGRPLGICVLQVDGVDNDWVFIKYPDGFLNQALQKDPLYLYFEGR